MGMHLVWPCRGHVGLDREVSGAVVEIEKTRLFVEGDDQIDVAITWRGHARR